MRRRWIAILGVFLAGACSSSVRTEFPPGIELEEAAEVAWPAEAEGLHLVSGEDEALDVAWVHAKGYVNAPIEVVSEAFLAPALMVDQQNIDTYEAVWDVEPEYPVSVRVHQEVHGLITVAFDVTWRQAPKRDASGELLEYGAVYQKTDGSTLIRHMSGSIWVRRVSDDASSIEIVSRLGATGVDADDLAASVQGMYDALLLAVDDAR